MLRGQNLSGARVEAVGRGVRTGLVRVNESGTYVFVDVLIDRDAKPGSRLLRVTTAAGSADANFSVSEPLPRAGRFQGFTQDDVIYFIMPDRFADGDRSNNDPRKSPGLYDRTKGRYYHGGDFQGVIDHLPYLKELGVTAVWINPVYDNTDRLDEKEMYPEVEGGPRRPTTAYHGYGAIDFYLGPQTARRRLGSTARRRIIFRTTGRSGRRWIRTPPTRRDDAISKAGS
jgi:hypothetical protein